MVGGRPLGLLLAAWVSGCGGAPRWSDAQAAWQARRPHAFDAWQAVAAGPDGAEAAARLRESARLYEVGVEAFERGDADATNELRAAAEIGPIEPSLYLRLARACRAQGASVRAADFYRKLIAERRDPTAEHELAQIDRDVSDPFEPPQRAWPRWPLGFLLLLPALLVLRRSRIDLARVLEEHPERAVAFAYQVGVLRHELFKHGLRPFRDGKAAPSGPAVKRQWQAHLDDLGLLLGLPRDWVRREPSFAAVDATIAELARGRSTTLGSVDALERRLVAWVKLARHTRVDVRLLDAIVDSLRDEHAGRKLPASLVVGPPIEVPTAAIYEHDLALVLRNLLRNALEVGASVLLEVHVFVDETGTEWVRIGVHDPSSSRPRSGASDRGLGIVRATLERYGGALLDGTPAEGYEKALVVSIPAADEAATDAALHRRAA